MAGDNGPIHTNGPNKDASGDGDGDGDTCAADQRSSPSKKMKTSPKSKPPNNARATQVIRPPDFFLPPYLRRYVHHSQGDFFVSSSFDPRLIAELMYEGFLPIASPRYLVPKLHKHRCVIYPLRTQTKSKTPPPRIPPYPQSTFPKMSKRGQKSIPSPSIELSIVL